MPIEICIVTDDTMCEIFFVDSQRKSWCISVEHARSRGILYGGTIGYSDCCIVENVFP